MARVNKSPQVLNFFIYFCITICCFTNIVSATSELDEDNWRKILNGEWMVEFYAPWCPACNALAPTWKELTDRAIRKSLDMNTAAVDVTKSPGLSGRFVVTALPTIFHVKDGEFRQYKGPRNVEAMLSYVQQQKWKNTEPISAWKSPDSVQMSLVAHFFKLSQALRSVHNMLMETYGLPTWGSYLIFALVTIFIGALLGLLMVCVIDFLYPPRGPGKVTVSLAEADRRKAQKEPNKSDDEQELINDDIVDDAEHSQNSDAEKNSPSDTEEEAQPAAEGSGDDKPCEVRKRRPRKAD
ncbi:thioredoxin-related transmembrane protein 1-like [Battus philenor]|uniref:thioredoxin-related transmembrane protein 1-like n=1 Tax=Battus philenor TaxID=42288 RepID=UPI0035D0F786